jgi:transposase-like protein
LFRRLRSGISTREYEAAAEAVPEAFGLSKPSVSRRFVQANAAALAALHTRRHDDRQWLVLWLDGETFAEDHVVIALGVTPEGEKRVLGLVQTATEHKRTGATFLRELIDRGFAAPAGLLVVLDGAKGRRAAVRDVFGDKAVVQRCQWHTRETVVRYLTKPQQILWRRKLREAYAHGGYAEAERALHRLINALAVLNESAARRLEEGLEETLTLHRFNLPDALRRSLNTTNRIASVMAQIERKTQRVDHWRTSDQKQRWCAATLLHIEKNSRRIRGMAHLPLLQAALTQHPSQTIAAA